MLQRILTFCRRLMGGSPTATGGQSDDERRVWVRYPSCAQATVKPLNNGVDSRLSGRVRNVSRGGVALVVNKRLEPGAMISVELPSSSDEQTATILACVVHVSPAADKQW